MVSLFQKYNTVKIKILLFLIFLNTINLDSQTQLSGIINHYTPIKDISYCESKIKVQSSSNFQIEDRILIIQMKGAIIDESNNSSFGDILDIQSTGLFEIGEIIDIQGNDIFLKHLLLNEYQIEGLVQLISFPRFEQATVVDLLTAEEWNGATGGVLAFEVEQTLTLEDTISVSGLGFRGGQKAPITSDCNFLTFSNNYFYDTGNWRGAPKGEGIANFIQGKENGRGKQANGGGGGNDHNTGGGGGSNFGSGGLGGEQTTSLLSCNGLFPGSGGLALNSLNNRFFLGGGGGSGHNDNSGFGTSGSNGAGIILIIAKKIVGNNQSILANGETPVLNFGDGAGGGGAGGSVLLMAEDLEGGVMISAKGGNGGNISSDDDRCYGPGGGGGGGAIRYASNLNLQNYITSGGAAGENLIIASQCTGPSNGATSGGEGTEASFSDPIPMGTIEVIATEIIQQPVNQSKCVDEMAVFEILANGNFLQYQWQIDTGMGFEDLENGNSISGADSSVLVFSNLGLDLNNAQLQCVMSNNCDSLNSETVTLHVQSAPLADFVTSFDGLEVTYSNLSTNFDSVFWDFGDGNFSNDLSPIHDYDSEDNYLVILYIYSSCGSDTLSQNISLFVPPSPDFEADMVEGCAPITVQFSDLSIGNGITNWQWSFPGGLPNSSTEQNPTIGYLNPGIFPVSLWVMNQAGEIELEKEDYIHVEVFPDADFEFEINDLMVSFQNTSIGGLEFLWDFGDGNFSNEENPEHTYNVHDSYQVTLTVTSFSCGSTLEKTVLLMPDAVFSRGNIPAINIFPNPVRDMLFIKLENSAQEFSTNIFSNNGLVFRNLGTERSKIKTSNFSPGIYWIQLVGEDWTYVQKIIIK